MPQPPSSFPRPRPPLPSAGFRTHLQPSPGSSLRVERVGGKGNRRRGFRLGTRPGNPLGARPARDRPTPGAPPTSAERNRSPPRAFLRDSGRVRGSPTLRPRPRARAPIGGAAARGVSEEGWNAVWAARSLATAVGRPDPVQSAGERRAGPGRGGKVPAGLERAERPGFPPAVCRLPALPGGSGAQPGPVRTLARAEAQSWSSLLAGGARGGGESGVRTGRSPRGRGRASRGCATCEPGRVRRRRGAGGRDLRAPRVRGRFGESWPHSAVGASLRVPAPGVCRRGRVAALCGWPWSSLASPLGTAWPWKRLSWCLLRGVVK